MEPWDCDDANQGSERICRDPWVVQLSYNIDEGGHVDERSKNLMTIDD